MNICKIITRKPSHALFYQNVQFASRCFSTSTHIEEKFDVPKRIPRSPTDILRALESTVGRDTTAGHYKYHDDPYLIPMSNTGKRTFAMAQEAGRKAAHWVRKEHGDLFNAQEAEPPIEAFFPPMVYNKTSKVALEDLNKLIETVQVSDATLVFKLLRDNGVEVPLEVQQRLLELLCFHNSEDGLSPEFIEERWFRQSNKAKEKVRKTWKDGEFAEELFIQIENPSAEAYSALIQGMTKYQQVNRAWELFEEAQQKNLHLNTNTYNSILSVVNFIKENADMRWTLVTNLLGQMQKSKLKPNLGTLNAVLQTVSTMGQNKTAKSYVLQILSEFKSLGIEPSLATWSYVLNTFYKERGPVNLILADIINHLENKSHTIRDLKDVNFFVTAMEVCRYQLSDVELARRVNNLLHFGNNYDFIGDSYKESVYFRHYFALLCSSLPLEEFMHDVYEKLVPHIYVPEPGIMAEVLKQVDLHGAINYLPKLWSDMIIFDHTQREDLVEIILNSMVNNFKLSNPELNEKFANTAWDLYTRIETRNEHKVLHKLAFTGDLLGKILILLLRNKEFEKSCTIMEKLDKNQQTIVGVPKLEALSLFVDRCIEEKSPSRAIDCIQYCSDSGFPEANALAAKLNEKLILDENYQHRLKQIVGDISLPDTSSTV